MIDPDAGLRFSIFPADGRWKIETSALTVCSEDNFVVYWRDHDIPSQPSTESLNNSVMAEEALAFLNGWISFLAPDRCLDHPMRHYLFDNKLIQAALARKVGLRVPNSLATNIPSDLRSFLLHSKSVSKLMSNVSFIALDCAGEFIYTSTIPQDYLAFVEDVRCCPTYIQQLIDKVADVRVTVVGRQLFSAITIPENSGVPSIDFREIVNLPACTHVLPSDIETAILRLMDEMSVEFAAIDLGMTADGSYYFFEANITGNWLWIEQEASLPISAAIAQRLESMCNIARL
ncbi:MAG: hypothetical protein VW395_09070 [Methylotenera sp.]